MATNSPFVSFDDRILASSGPYNPRPPGGAQGPPLSASMFNALGVLLQIAQGLGLVNTTPLVEQVEGAVYRYASSAMSSLLKVRMRQRTPRGGQ